MLSVVLHNSPDASIETKHLGWLPQLVKYDNVYIFGQPAVKAGSKLCLESVDTLTEDHGGALVPKSEHLLKD